MCWYKSDKVKLTPFNLFMLDPPPILGATSKNFKIPSLSYFNWKNQDPLKGKTSLICIAICLNKGSVSIDVVSLIPFIIVFLNLGLTYITWPLLLVKQSIVYSLPGKYSQYK